MWKTIGKLLLYGIAILTLLPLILVATGSLMGSGELKSLISPVFGEGDGYAKWHFIPLYPTFKNIVELVLDTPEYYVLFWNSVKVVVCILIGQILFAVPAAWGFSQSKNKWSKFLFPIYIFCMLLPFQVTVLSQYLVLNSLSLINTHLSLILPMVFSTFPVFIIYQSFRQIPESVLDAARVDGAGNFQIFRYIGIPIGLQGILAAMVVGFLEYWNMVEQPIVFIKEKTKWLLSIYLPNINTDNAGVAFAYSFFSILPALLIFWFGRKLLEQGVMMQGELDNEK